MYHSLLIGAATSGSGKTTFTMGLLRALRRRKLNVQPFKCGPDYIDPMFHSLASGHQSVNLDTWLCTAEHVKELYYSHSAGSDVSVAEGVMGLFDGYDRSKGSSAEIAQILDIPVILVVSAKSVAYSVAPLIHGFRTFNPSLRIAGVVFNHVASERHYTLLRSACEDAHVPCLGYMQRNPNLNIPGRHLGLTIAAKTEMEKLIDNAADEVEKHVDIDTLLELTASNSTPLCLRENESVMPVANRPVIAVARDEAFNFIYASNIDVLRHYGNVVFFSPLRDTRIPDCDLLYLPGGYPELFSDQLSANKSMMQSICDYAENDGYLFAECGGFMYLTQAIDEVPMCGVLPFETTMDGAKLHLGYRQFNNPEVVAEAFCGFPFLPQTTMPRGHEFHYSTIRSLQDVPPSIRVFTAQSNAQSQTVDTQLFRYRNVVAGYTHWQFL